MDRLIEVLSPQPDEHLVFLGDYIDRGPDSRGVIARCLDMQKKYRCTFLRGNHEAYMIDYLDGQGNLAWMANGGAFTVDSYLTAEGALHIPPEQRAFVRATRSYLDTPDYFFVHGGLHPGLTIAENIARCDEEEFLWLRPPGRDQPVAWEKTVVVGHTPVPAPMRRHRMIGIDTGCVYVQRPELGRLTAVRLPAEEFVSVANVDVHSYVPNQKPALNTGRTGPTSK